MKEAESRLKGQHRAYCWGRTPAGRGTLARELEPTAASRLEVDTGEQSGGETPLGGKILLEGSGVNRG
jgi:hypothetical protein